MNKTRTLSSLKEEHVTFRNAYERCRSPVGKKLAKGLVKEIEAKIDLVEFDRRIERGLGI